MRVSEAFEINPTSRELYIESSVDTLTSVDGTSLLYSISMNYQWLVSTMGGPAIDVTFHNGVKPGFEIGLLVIVNDWASGIQSFRCSSLGKVPVSTNTPTSCEFNI